jgi:hypothetical protein
MLKTQRLRDPRTSRWGLGKEQVNFVAVLPRRHLNIPGPAQDNKTAPPRAHPAPVLG